MFLHDLSFILSWWGMLFLLGGISLPVTTLIFKNLKDGGYGFAKIIGILVPAYIVFLLSITKFLAFSFLSLYISIGIWTGINIGVLKYTTSDFFPRLKKLFNILLFQELWFGFGLVFWSFVRGNNPDIRGLEKFMDYGFVTSSLTSKFLPPSDMWFAGNSINYYWFGHFITAVLTKLSGIASEISYNLMIATIAGLVLSSVFSLVSSLLTPLTQNTKLVFFAGILTSLLLVFGGNFHTPFYVFKEGGDKYWYPDATRFIGYNPDVPDKTIHEFPNYSFVVADLHAHLLNLPFVLLFLALLFSFISDFSVSSHSKSKLKVWSLVVENWKLILLGFLLGIFFMTNTWDVGNYGLVLGIVFFVFSFLRKDRFKNILTFIQPGFLIVLIAGLTAWPFIAHFVSIAQGIKFVHSHSPFWQLFLLWGFPFVSCILFLFTVFRKNSLQKLTDSDIFILCLFAATFILIALPEIMYVKDIYTATHYRANTMFKLTYQAFVIGYIASGFALFRILLSLKKKQAQFLFSLSISILSASLLSYSYYSIGSYYGKLKIYKGLGGTAWMTTLLPERAEIVNWFKTNVSGQPTILEAPGDSYTDYNIVSSYTGLPTVSGWFVHEWLWRGDSSFPQQRVSDITQIYTSLDLNETKNLLQKYNVEYVIVGIQEKERFSNLREDKFNMLGKKVFTSDQTAIYKIL